MRKKQKIGIFDIGRLESTPVALPQGDAAPVGTLKQYREKLAREEAESAARLQSAIAEQQAQASRTIKACLETSAPLKARFWSQPLDRLKVSLNDEDAYDELFLQKDSTDVDSNEIFDRVMAFVTNVPSLEMEDERRFSLYVACQVLNDVVVNDESLTVMFDRCVTLGIFKGRDVDFLRPVQPKPRAVQPEPQRESLDDFESIDTSSRDGSRRAKNLAENLYIEEFLPLARQWVQSLEKHYGFTPSSEDMRRVSDFIAKRNLSRLAPATYDAARIFMCDAGYWNADKCLTETEKYLKYVESVDLTRITHEQKQMLRRREMQARESDLARYGHV
jgi:hypothetical protein